MVEHIIEQTAQKVKENQNLQNTDYLDAEGLCWCGICGERKENRYKVLGHLKGTARNLRATPRAFYQSDVIIIIQWLYISDHWKLVLLLSSEQTVSGYQVCIHL